MIVMDNCSSHHSANIKRLCEQAGVELLYLPPYSPDFNPIEEYFSVLKAWMKKNCALAERMHFVDFLKQAIVCNPGTEFARNHFRHASIHVD